MNFDFNKNKKLWVAVLVLVGAGTLSGGVYYTWLITPPGPPKTAQEAMKTIGSARFDRMPDYRKQEYMEQAGKLFREMPDDQRRKLWHDGEGNPQVHKAMETMRENFMDQRLNEFAKATPEDRIKMLDQMIDMQEKMRKMGRGPWGGPPGGGQGAGAGQGGDHHRGGGPGHHDPGRMRERIKRMAEQGNPQRAGLRMEFFKAMQERRIQRGLPPGGFGRH
jgi:hypothetical protein